MKFKSIELGLERVELLFRVASLFFLTHFDRFLRRPFEIVNERDHLKVCLKTGNERFKS